MQISLDDLEIEYLRNKIKNDTWWTAQHILNKFKAGEELEETRKNCHHHQGTYIGKKICCTKCGGYQEGQGEEWTLQK